MIGLSLGLGLRGAGGFSPASWFTSGGQGVWYDPSDLTTMFQDHQGVTPVSGAGQTVGLMLDKRIGTRVEVFSDANVTFSGPAGYAERVSTGVYRFCSDAGGIGSVVFGGLTSGKSYLVEMTVAAYDGAVSGITGLRADFFSALGIGIRSAVFAAGVCRFYYKADGTSFLARAGGGGLGAKISSISIKEVAGNHALQTGATSLRPLLQQDAGGRYYILFDGTDDFLVTSAIDFTGTNKMSVFAGVRKLNDTDRGMIAELDASAATAGKFGLSGPDFAGQASYGVILNGATGSTYYQHQTFTAPVSNVISANLDISGASRSANIQTRINGAANTSGGGGSGTGLGGGNFGNHALYIGRRGGTTLPFNGRLYGLIVRGAASTATEIAQAESWMNSKTGAY
ncbi:MAG: hypothetical protein RL268_197 [Pseudomonadota bacterium]|jgi:hypothetical protein